MLRFSTFTKADLRATNFRGANLRETMMDEVKAEGATFVGANLAYADFSNSDVRRADFGDANLSDALLHNVKDDGASFVGATMSAVRRTDPDRLEAESFRPPRKSAGSR
jgi:uncharacterized protein YjbI with pentapeptide repeats